jgi:outer membrane protein insertion porin family
MITLRKIILNSAALATVLACGVQASAYADDKVAKPAIATAQTIGNIIVKGNQRVETETILAYLAIQPGQKFNAELADMSLKSLFATGFFADVQFEQNDDNLIVNVKENPTVNQVLFEGQKSLTTEKIEKEVQIKPRAWFSVGRVQADKKRLIEVYRRSGHFSTQITPKIIEKPQNRVDLVFEIKEGPKTGIRAINFIGNGQYSDDQLKSVIATQESKWYKFFSSRDNFDPDMFEYDREQLNKHYTNNGYYDFNVTSAVAELNPNQKDFLLTFSLDEGEKYKFGDIKVNAQLSRLSPDVLKAMVPVKTGAIYQHDLIEKSIEAITFAAGAAGYAFVDVRPREVANKENNTVDIVFDVDEGPRVYVEKIDIIGNSATMDNVIRREMRLAEGDAFNRVLIDSSKNRIKALGFFKDVEIDEKKGSLPDRTIVEVKVEEQPTGELAFSLGYSSQDAYQFDVSITERNLRGRGQFFRFRVAASSYTKNVDIRFTEPRFLGRNIAAGIDIFSIETDYLQYANFLSTSTGANLRVGFLLSEYMNMGLNYTYRVDKIDVPYSSCFDSTGAISATADTICASAGNYVTSLIGYNINLDKRNNPIRPTRGYEIDFSQQFAGIGSGVKYVRNEFNASIYRGIAPGWVASAKLNAGYISGYGGDAIRIRDRFFKGGQEFRGFKIAGIGPRRVQAYRAVDTTTSSGYSDTVTYSYLDALGGKAFYIGTMELTVPTPLPESYKIGAALFVDVGSLGLLDDADKFSGDVQAGVYQTTRDGLALRASSGLSVFWESPFGPVRFDFSYPLLKEDYDKTENFRFSTSTRF